MATRAPSLARRSAMPRPMRFAAPVIRTTSFGIEAHRRDAEAQRKTDRRLKVLAQRLKVSAMKREHFTPPVRHVPQSPPVRFLAAPVRAIDPKGWPRSSR